MEISEMLTKIKPQAGKLSIAGLSVLFLAVLSWGSAGSTPATAPSAVDQQAGELKATPVITIGVSAALSGSPDFIGWRQVNAVQLAISQTNAAGGISVGGVVHSLTLVTADSACNPGQAVTAANTLLNAGAAVVVGDTCSSASLAAQPIYHAAGVAMVSASSSSLAVTEQGYTTTFRVVPRDDAQAVLMATYFRRLFGMDAVALVESPGFAWSTDAFSRTFTSLGGTITSRHAITSPDNYTATLTAIRPENPAAVFYVESDANNAGFFSRIAHGLGLEVIGWDTTLDNRSGLDIYVAAAGAAAEGDYAGLYGRQASDMPGYAAFNTAYRAAGFPHYGDEAAQFGAYAYDAAKIIIAAVGRAASPTPGAIRAEIAATANHNGVVGTYKGFDSKGDVLPQWSWVEQYWNGQWVMVDPYHLSLPLVLKNFP